MPFFHDGIEPVQVLQACYVACERRHVSCNGCCGFFQLLFAAARNHDPRAFLYKALAVAKPIPLFPPVMTATFNAASHRALRILRQQNPGGPS